MNIHGELLNMDGTVTQRCIIFVGAGAWRLFGNHVVAGGNRDKQGKRESECETGEDWEMQRAFWK